MDYHGRPQAAARDPIGEETRRGSEPGRDSPQLTPQAHGLGGSCVRASQAYSLSTLAPLTPPSRELEGLAAGYPTIAADTLPS